MNTRRRRLIIVSAVLLCMLIQGAQANPNHLEPIAPYDPMDSGYDRAVFTSLVGKYWASLWMIEMPSFSREYAVILRCNTAYDPNDTRPVLTAELKSERWLVEYVVPKEKIWRWKDVDDTHSVLDIKPTEDVERHHTYITKDLAQALQEAWLSTLQLTRYAEDRRKGLDGTTVQFYCGGLFGQTWSPGPGLPAQLAELGRKLRALALSDEKSKEPLLKEADDLARKIAKEAEAEQIKLFGKKLSHITWSSVLNRKDRASQTGEAR
jgi:hypothetical protein